MNQILDHQGNQIPIMSSKEWEIKRGRVLEKMQEVMGPLPGKERVCDLDVRVEVEEDCGVYLRQLISYQSEPGARTPAYLLIPKSVNGWKIRIPAVLCLHPTDKIFGHKTVVGLSEKPNRSYAHELAERGFVTLAPSYPLLGEYHPDLNRLGYQSGTMKAIWDNIRGLDLLESLPFVKPNFGSIGHSLGGHNSVFTAAFEQRIQMVVSSCGLDSFLDYKDGDITGWTSDRYMPKLGLYSSTEIPFDFHDIIGALAPRPCFISAPLNDSNFKWQSVDTVAEAASRIYSLYGASGCLNVEHPNCYHDFPKEIREKAYRLLEIELF